MRITQVDAFADSPFSGNPAAVCLLREPRDEKWMQSVALEMNLSETAFLVRRDDGFALRWFTPAVEVNLCGHATLASAHVLWEEGHLDQETTARFHTKSGLLTAERRGDHEIVLDFPARPAEASTEGLEDLQETLGASILELYRDREDYLAVLQDEKTVRELRPDFHRMRGLGLRGAIVTSRTTSEPFDFVSRFFVPGAGIDEDPVTGSAHCMLAPFWSARIGRDQLFGWQASARGGRVRTRVRGDRVELGGRAITVMRGDLLV